MRIVAGAWRGRKLTAPPGQATRPTADRARQALFDMLMHSTWAGRPAIEGATVLDVFAGTGALGLEALSRGASKAVFIESDTAALRALRTNIAACGAQHRAHVLAADVLGPSELVAPRRPSAGAGPRSRQLASRPAGPAAMAAVSAKGDDQPDARPSASLVFLDPPYGEDLVPRALSRLTGTGRVGANALVVAETNREETWVPEQPLLAERLYGAARILVFRMAGQ